MNQDVNENRKLFWMGVSDVKRGKDVRGSLAVGEELQDNEDNQIPFEANTREKKRGERYALT